jgi:branched-chain amino acid transport system permease protein
MVNVLSGIYQPEAGQVYMDHERLSGMPAAAIASKGLARTFQNVQLFNGLSVIENVLVALHHTYESNTLDVALSMPSYLREENGMRNRAIGLLDLVGLSALAEERANNLSYGKQRLLEIARALALSPKVLLLDEPAAGLTAPDIQELIALIERLRARGLTLLLIEHHMDVVMTLCDRITVLDFGRVIAEGTPEEIRRNPKVIDAYLGAEAA